MDEDIRRIGFAMGEAGACSRILTTAFGAPVTYASFGEPVAPGQLAIDDLLTVYQAMTLNRQTRVVAVVGDDAAIGDYIVSFNQRFQADQQDRNRIAIPFASEYLDALKAHKNALRIDDIRDGS